MNRTRTRLELEVLEERETPSASPLALGGFNPVSIEGMVGPLSGQLGAILNSVNAALAAFQQAAASGSLSSFGSNFPVNAQELSPLSGLLGSAVQSMQLGGNS